MKFRDEKYLIQLGLRIANLRKAKGLTQEVLADSCGLSLSQIARIETGFNNPTICTLVIIARELSLTPSELLNFDFQFQ